LEALNTAAKAVSHFPKSRLYVHVRDEAGAVTKCSHREQNGRGQQICDLDSHVILAMPKGRHFDYVGVVIAGTLELLSEDGVGHQCVLRLRATVRDDEA
jgi:hypothetical protein